MPQSIPLMLGMLLVTGLLFGMLASRLRIPRIAAYALAGFIWSPGLLGDLFSLDMTSWSGGFTDVALAIMAYLIGGSVTMSQLRRLGRVIVMCTIGEVVGAIIAVTTAIWLLLGAQTEAVPLAVALGILAASSTPATTVAVIHQYRTHGNLTTTLLGVVALDDAFGVILFSLMLVWMAGDSLASAMTNASSEILGGLALGAVIGGLLAFFGHRVKNRNFFLPMILGALLLSQGLAEAIQVSPLLTAMAMGFAARAAFKSGGERLFASIEYLDELVFLIFFTLAGAYFEFNVFYEGTWLVLVYVSARIVGKVVGAGIAAKFSQAPANVQGNLGIALIPQAGIEIGLALSLLHMPGFEATGLLVLNVILASTLIYEFIGPLATHYALSRAGEIKERKAHG